MHMYLAFVQKLNYVILLTNGRKEDSGCYVSFSTDSADQIVSWILTILAKENFSSYKRERYNQVKARRVKGSR